MSADPNKKSARTFQSRDVLWDTFNQMAHELECSVDYLINEAMKQYARQRSNAGIRTPYPVPSRSGEPPASDQGAIGRTATPGALAPLPPPTRVPAHASALPPPPSGRAPATTGRPTSLPAPPPRGGSLPVPPPAGRGASAAAMTQGARPVVPPPSQTRSAPPPLPRPPTPVPPQTAVANGFPSPAPVAHANTLSIVYQGERQTITKDRFVIGRGKQSSDLTLKDPNVSRQHAMVEFQNGVYFMVDMGSTNGVEHNGQRIARRQIAEGDVYRICDHAITFTYR
jgi:pSer/pThr/pTyr-binding forkhead associated (FHA) protein